MVIALQCTPDQFLGLLHAMIGITGGPQLSLHVTIGITGGPQVQERTGEVDLVEGGVYQAGQGVQGRTADLNLMKRGIHQAGQGVQGVKVVVLRGLINNPTGMSLSLQMNELCIYSYF